MIDLLTVIQDCGPRALGIVSLISFLIGLILGFVGAVQLQQFGASIFVANLVAIAMTREIGCIMTAIVMAGRTGAAFAAQLGTMNTNQEIDALSTMGISPMEFLVLPRMLALILMMPLLTIYADLVGILGGAVVGVGMLGLGPVEYFEQTRGAVSLTDFFIGVGKSAVFGVLVALVGCLRGMQSGRSAAAVGPRCHLGRGHLHRAHHRHRRHLRRDPECPPPLAPRPLARRRPFPDHRGRSHDGLRELRHPARPLLHDRAGRDLRDHGRERFREEHAARTTWSACADPAKGDVLYDGQSFWHSADEERDHLRRRLGVSYQAGALWSSMTLARMWRCRSRPSLSCADADPGRSSR
jgi:ABC transport permease subunit